MINEYYAKLYCCEDLSLIENYALAIADMSELWDCHHRGEILPCGRFKAEDLMKFGLYYNRPASELIFLTHAEHSSLHHKGVSRPDLKGVPKSEAHKQALSDALKGVPLSEATKKAISDAMKGVPKSEAHKLKLSKKVLQYTKSGEFVREWPSMAAVWQELGIAQSSICRCCKGKLPSAGGYIWKYSNI